MLPCGQTAGYAYDAVGAYTNMFNPNLSGYGGFTYDGAFKETGLSAQVPGATSLQGTTSYAYDAKDRLTGESSQRLGGYSQASSYDEAGNPTTLRGASASFNADNQSAANAYDGDGNPTTYGSAALAFGPEGWATALPNGVTAGYRADGLRAWKADAAGNRSYFYYDGGEPTVETDGSGNVTVVNVFAPDGLVAREQGGGWTQYAFDPEGSVALRLDSAGDVLSSSVYDAYGTESSTATPSDPFGYHARDGYYADRETGLYLCGHRYYDPGAGRWLNRDPWVEIRYVHNNPVGGACARVSSIGLGAARGPMKEMRHSSR